MENDNSFLEEIKKEEQNVKSDKFKEAQSKNGIPEGYTIRNNELYQLKPIMKQGEVVDYEYRRVSREIPRIKHRMEDVENEDSYHVLEFEDLKKDTKREIQVPTMTISHSRELVNLSAKGLSVNTNNAPLLIDYFDRYQGDMDIPQKKTVTRLGHIKGRFVHPEMKSDYEIITNETEYKKIKESITAKGSLQDYKENVFDLLKDSDTALFSIYTALSSLLLEEYKIEPSIVDISGQTSKGKTGLLRTLASLYGKYDDLLMTWDTTEINVNRRAVFLNSFPLLIDDTQKAKYKNLVSNVTYQFSSGKERGRANLTGLEETKPWRNFLISTGENAITTFGDNKGGQAARTITIETDPFDSLPKGNKEFFKKLYKGIDNYHGTVAIEFYKQFTSNKNYYSKAFEDFEQDFRNRSDSDVMQRLARLFAVIKVGGLILDELPEFANDYDAVCDQVFHNMLQNNKAIDKPREVLDNLLSELDSKRAFLISDKREAPERGEMIGGIKSEYVAVFPSFLNKELKHEKAALIKEWAARGYLLTDKKTYQKQVKFGRSNRRMYCIDSFIARELGYDFQTGVTGTDVYQYETHEADEVR